MAGSSGLENDKHLSISISMEHVSKKVTAREVAEDILQGMMWESDHFGYCSIQCIDDRKCPAIFHFDGGLKVVCINKQCKDSERQYDIPSSMLGKIADRWNQDKNRRNNVVSCCN